MSTPEQNTLTLVYHKVDELEIKLDLYLPTNDPKDKSLPVIIAFHGGGLFIGDRSPSGAMPMWLRGTLI